MNSFLLSLYQTATTRNLGSPQLINSTC